MTAESRSSPRYPCPTPAQAGTVNLPEACVGRAGREKLSCYYRAASRHALLRLVYSIPLWVFLPYGGADSGIHSPRLELEVTEEGLVYVCGVSCVRRD